TLSELVTLHIHLGYVDDTRSVVFTITVNDRMYYMEVIMPYLPLSQGKQVLVDPDDYYRFGHDKWCFKADKRGSGYAVRNVRVETSYRLLPLARAIMDPPDGHEVVYLNHNSLDCRRENLHVVTKDEASRLHRVRRDSRSGVKGVSYSPKSHRFAVTVN